MLTNCHSQYSLKYGTLSIEQMLNLIKENGYSEFVLTDINNTAMCVDAVRQAAEIGLKPIIGIDFRNGIQQQYVGIAKNNIGLKELNIHVSHHLHNETDFATIAPEFENAYVIYPFATYTGWNLRDNQYIGVSINDLKRLPFTKLKINEDKLVVMQPLTFLNKRGFNAHRLLRAIHNNVLLSRLPVSEQTSPDEIIHERSKLLEAFKDYPVLIKTTQELLDSCHITVEYGKFANKNLTHYTGTMKTDMELLRNESYAGLQYRYGDDIELNVLDRLEKELRIIEQMKFASYFLINWDIVKYAQSKGYYYVGRGSGSNSIVAYLLLITDVDPIDLDLYFERFINPFRSNPPDFDIDFSWTDRDDMTDYIFQRFGKNGCAALVGTYTTFQSDSVLRELGKVFGLPPNEIDALQREADLKKVDEIGKLVLYYSDFIKGFPSNFSIHASGILISQEPVTTYVSTFLPPKGYPTTHFSMLEAEDIGLYKFDILSQRGLGKIKDCLDIVKQNHNVDIDIHDMKPILNDERIKTSLRSGNAIGCFYVESPGMRMLLCKLQADDYLRLVAASSIIRPGVAKSGMMREYILRYRDEKLRKKAEDALPELYKILEETYGVMVYQEDVIKVAHSFAGLSLAESDYLRRGMSWKFKQRNEFFRVRQQFFDNCYEKGYNEKVITDIWNQIESFANFAFSKGHSASYAVESYQALFLKAYYPIEYMAATLNNGGGFYRAQVYLQEAIMHGATLELPCINKSDLICRVYDRAIYLGFNMINGLEKHTMELIMNAREQEGEFKDLPDFTKRVPASVDQLCLLIRAGTFKFTGKSKQTLLWDVYSLLTPYTKKQPDKELFHVETAEYKLPVLQKNKYDEIFDEMELFGFTRELPFNLLKDELPSTLKATDFKQHLGQIITIVGFMVNIKTTQTSKGDKMYFGTFYDLDGQWIDTVHFPQVAKAFPFTGPGCYVIKGKVTHEFDFYSLDVVEQKRLQYVDRDSAKHMKKDNTNMRDGRYVKG
jgi:DNA polymerase III subunit alpha